MFRRFLHRFRSLFRKGRLEREMEKELRFHLEMEAEKNIRRGMNEEEARLAAQRSFGGIEQTKEAYRDLVRFRWIEDLWQDLRYGARMLGKNPGFTVIAVLALALGIGANTAIFSVVNAVLFKSLPYYDPQRLVYVTEDKRGKEGGWDREYAGSIDYILWQAESKSFDHLVAFNWGNTYLTGRGEPERLDSVWATANLFPALGVAPQLGRTFTPEEDRLLGSRVVILSHSFWQRRFGGDPAIIGQSLTLDRESRQVIGVMPPDFKFIQKADVLLPLAINVQLELTRNVDGGVYLLDYIIGRLKPGVSVEQARSELDSILQRGKKANPKGSYGDRTIVAPLGERLVGNLRRGLLVLFGAVAFILLIACANVANLMLARAQVRQKEMAIRAAMGAGRGRLVRQMLTESLLLSICGGVAGLLLALLGVKALAPLIPDNLAHLKEGGIDGVALGFTFLASLLTGIVAGIFPALQASQIDLNESLKEGARGAAFSKRKSARLVSPALVIGELALTLVLLIGAGLLIKSFLRVLAVEPGYNPENLLTMATPLSSAGYSLARKRLFYQGLLTRINSLPGVKVAAVGPLPQRMDVSSGSEWGIALYIISADYFRATGVQLRAGRGFTEQDSESAPPVVVINETYARRHFAGEDPIGKRITYGFDGPRRIYGTIVGVVADVKRYGLEDEAQSAEYHSVLQGTVGRDLNLMARTAGDPLKLASAVRQQVWAIDPNMPVVDVMSMEQRLAESIAPRGFQMLLFGAFAAVALVLAAVGVYGVISHSVGRRTHEIGIRMALGARPRDLLAMVIRQGMSLALVGAAIGLAAALALARLMASFLFDVKATDPATFAGVSLLLVSVAFLAAYFPARRATKVDPMVALKHE
jgi:predicted permease